MASDHSIRASDQDRDAVVATLRDAYTAGRLTLEEFDERMTAAYASRTWGELRKLTEDLPAPALPTHPPRAHGSPPPPTRHRRRPVALFPLVALWVLLALATRTTHE